MRERYIHLANKRVYKEHFYEMITFLAIKKSVIETMSVIGLSCVYFVSTYENK